MYRDLQMRKQTWLARATVLGSWLLFALMVVAISWGGSASRNRPFDFVNTVVWNLGWVLWAIATFGVRTLVRWFPIERRRLARTLLIHVGFGVAVTTLMLSAEFLLNDALQRIWPSTVRPNPFVSFIVYKFHIYFLVYWLIVGASGAYDYYTQLQRSELTASQLQAQLALAQVHALKMQLHPHFLFNTHHSIISLMLKNENPAAIKMLTRLSDLLRITLKKTDQATNSLREELEMLDLYLGIQRERYRDRLVVNLDVDPQTLNADVPCLLLQPLVENALQHGIDPQTTGGKLTITAHQTDENLTITIRDNGPGFPTGFRLDQAQGVGLNNTRLRLQRLYGAHHQFVLSPAADGGAEVRIVLPLRMASLTAT